MNKVQLFFSKALVFVVDKCKNIYEKAYLYKLKPVFRSIGSNPILELPISLLGCEYISIGNNFIIRRDGKIRAYTDFEGYKYNPEFTIGNNVYLGTNCCLSAIGKITIGNNVTFASNITVMDHMHGMLDYKDINVPVMKRQLSSKGAIVIEDNVWIGEGVVILSGITIGKNSIIGANSVVTKSFPSNCIIAGVPAKIIKQIHNL
ncbi:MAG: acyltransferase [Candidatus Symbiothrix sp.]|jgi:acetyltransferase-like isoleucine patch superfamily enzyme|nr:acyltransferase [Candidatus Symbiothrix sp.]